MKSLRLLLFSVLLMQSVHMEAQLSKYQWKNRLLLVYAPSMDDAQFQNQKQTLEQNTDELQERDMLIFSVLGNKEIKDQLTPQTCKQLRQLHQVEEKDFQVILIGKDGGIKLKSKKTVPMSDLFALIDGMPMRRAEMRRKKNKS